MYRLALALVLSTQAAAALAAGSCTIAGTAYEFNGRPMQNAVVRLTDLHSRQTLFAAVDAKATFEFSGLANGEPGRYRLDVLSAPTIVTGSKIPTRSILGMSDAITCSAGMVTRKDVHVQVY